MRLVCGWYVVGMWLVCGWCVVSMWLVCGWIVVGLWSVCGWFVVGLWLVCGQHVVSMWLECGWIVVGMWLVCGRYVVGMWLVCGQYVVGLWLVCGWSVNQVNLFTIPNLSVTLPTLHRSCLTRKWPCWLWGVLGHDVHDCSAPLWRAAPGIQALRQWRRWLYHLGWLEESHASGWREVVWYWAEGDVP